MIGLNITKDELYKMFLTIIKQWPTTDPCLLVDTFAVTSSITDLTAENFNKSTVDLQLGHFWSRKSAHQSETFLKKHYPAMLVASTLGTKPRGKDKQTCYTFTFVLLDEMCKECPCKRTVEQMDWDLETIAEMFINEVRQYEQHQYTSGATELMSAATAAEIKATVDPGLKLKNQEIGFRDDVQIAFQQLEGLTTSTFRTLIWEMQFCICRKLESFPYSAVYQQGCCGED